MFFPSGPAFLSLPFHEFSGLTFSSFTLPSGLSGLPLPFPALFRFLFHCDQ